MMESLKYWDIDVEIPSCYRIFSYGKGGDGQKESEVAAASDSRCRKSMSERLEKRHRVLQFIPVLQI